MLGHVQTICRHSPDTFRYVLNVSNNIPNMFSNAITTEHCNHGPVHPIILYRDIQDSRDDEKIESDLVHSSPECVSDANVNKIFHFQNILSVETFHLGSLCTVSE